MSDFDGNAKALKRKYPATHVDRGTRCMVCNKPIKTRLTIQKATPPNKCYKHYKEPKRRTTHG